MVGGKKWLIVLTEEQHEWIKETSETVGIKGSDIVREVIDRTMSEDPKRFQMSLVQAQVKIKLKSLNDRKAAILEEETKLKRQLQGERVAA